MIDYNFVPETLDWCKRHYVPPVEKYISCKCFGNLDGTDGSCHWCKEMTPYQFEMCWDENHLRCLMSKSSRFPKKTREEAAEFIEHYKNKMEITNVYIKSRRYTK